MHACSSSAVPYACSSVLSAFGIARQEGSLGTVKCSFDRLAIHL